MKALCVLVAACLFCSGFAAVTNVTVHNLANHNERFAFSESRAATVSITWTTDVPATSRIVYGMAPGNLELSSRFDHHLKTRHMIRLQYRLAEGQTWYYQVVSVDANGNQMTSAVENFITPTDSEWWEVAHDANYKKDDYNDGTRWIQGGNFYRTTWLRRPLRRRC